MSPWCEECQGEGSEFCSSECEDCGLETHCNDSGLCRDCQDGSDEAAWERAQERNLAGEGPPSIQRQYEEAWEIKRRLR